MPDDLITENAPEETPSGSPTEGAEPKAPAAEDGDAAGADGADLLDTGAKEEAQSPSGDDLLSDDGTSTDEGVPDQYTFEPPEGFPALDEAKLAAFSEAAREHGFTQEQYAFALTRAGELTQSLQEGMQTAFTERVQEWRDAARADAEIGGENLNTSVASAMNVVQQFGDDEFKGLLKSPNEANPEGLAIGNHPAVLRFLNRVAKAVGEPDLETGDDRQQISDRDRILRMFPSMKPKSA